ncbi:uncharacterized protein LOC123274623, partial [Cotesia glomerata]|uniref:uncharacterized protein LOC123274623 n=1 Tax=Cotesia glomerata TaxID=32391 RepID=UPI001D032698
QSRNWNEPYEEEELGEKENTDRTRNNDNNRKNNSVKSNDLEKVINNSMEKIIDKMDEIHSKNRNELKSYIKNCVNSELNILKETLKEVITEEIKNVTKVWMEEMNVIRNSILSPSTARYVEENNNKSSKQDVSSKKELNKKTIERVVIIPSKKQESEVTLSQLTTNVDIIELGVRSEQSEIQEQMVGVILEIEKENDKEILVREIQTKLGGEYKVNVSNKKNPKIKIIGLEDSLVSSNGDIFIKNLIRQNQLNVDDSLTDNIKLLKLFKNRQGHGSAILEVNPSKQGDEWNEEYNNNAVWNSFEEVTMAQVDKIIQNLDWIMPDKWKISTVIPIQKIKDSCKAEDLRPINTLPIMEQILEQLVKDQLEKFIAKHNILNEEQSGFRKSHSCETALQNCFIDWRNSLDKGLLTGLLCIDLTKAFETINRQKLIAALEALGITGR